MFPEDEHVGDSGVITCAMSPSEKTHQFLRITINAHSQMSDIVAIHRGLADGSTNSKDQCPNAVSLPAVTLGGEVETALICQKDDLHVFEYYGRFDD